MILRYLTKSLLLAGVVCFMGCTPSGNSGSKIEFSKFMSPPTSTKVHTWWHWMDGNISKEGITRDLEAMAAAGIGQATILNIGLFESKDFGNKRIIFDTPEWYEMFEWALKEAERNNINIGVHNCDGWSSSGGKWIEPKDAMKQFVWHKNIISGGEELQISLPQPYSVNNFYEDIAVLAVQTNSKANEFVKSVPKIIKNGSVAVGYLYDGCPASGIPVAENDEFIIECNTELEVNRIALHPRKPFLWDNPDKIYAVYSVWASMDKKNWKKIGTVKIQGLNKTIIEEIPQTKSRYFKIAVDELNNINEWMPYQLSEMELLKDDEQATYHTSTEYLQSKTVSTFGRSTEYYSQTPESNSSEAVSSEVIDLTNKMDENGNLEWDAPQGNWAIIRCGYTITGAINAPATREGEGLEVDKMDTSSLNHHFNSFPAKLIDHSGNYLGNTFKFLLIDSWECSFQNWTARFPEAFSELNGYAIKQWLPALCGEIVENPEQTEAFLHDYRATISDMIENNYYKHFSKLCHENKLEMHAEVIYGGGIYPPLDVLSANSYVDFPMTEFWAGNNADARLAFRPSEKANPHFPGNAAMFYDKACGSEAYTGYAHYSESPWELKIYGDVAFCTGINQMILHSYVHQPNEKIPGFTLADFGQAFNRYNSYWTHVKGWMDYQARLQYILQNSKEVSDILYFVGDQLPQFIDNVVPEIPAGINLKACNFSILSKAKVVDGMIVTENGLTFSLLVLPQQERMNFKTLQLIERLANDGATIIGNKPEKVLSRLDEEHREAFVTLASELWKTNSENIHGKGKILAGISVMEAIQKLDLKPDFSVSADHENKFLFIHKRNTGTHYYFVVNQLNEQVPASCMFRTGAKSVEVWDAENMTSSQIKNFEQKGEICNVPFTFKPRQAVLFVIKDEESTAPDLKTKAIAEYDINDMHGSIEFLPVYDQTIEPVEINSLKPLTEFEDDNIKYFSGQATYKIQFELPDGISPEEEGLFLNLGMIEIAGTASLNGNKLGTVWSLNQEFEVGKFLKDENTLEIEIGIPLRNRFIGDMRENGEPQNLWTTCEITNFLKKETNLKKSGLMGPVKIIKR